MTKTVTISYEDFRMEIEVNQEFQEDRMQKLLIRYLMFMNELAESGMKVGEFTQDDVNLIGATLLIEEFTNIAFPEDVKEILDSGLALLKTNNLEIIMNQFPKSEMDKLAEYFKLFENYRENYLAKEEENVSC